jgi:hypothetical protein
MKTLTIFFGFITLIGLWASFELVANQGQAMLGLATFCLSLLTGGIASVADRIED